MRVVSLLPSATEIVCQLLAIDAHNAGHTPALVGRSHECDYPPTPELRLKDVPVLTAARTHFTSASQVDADVRRALRQGESLYTLDAPLLASLRPDLIITQDLCEVCSIDLATVRQVAAAMPSPPRVLSLNPTTIDGVFDDVLRIGQALGVEAAARDFSTTLRERAFAAEEFVNPFALKPVVGFLEWTDPLFVGGHWTPQLIERAGGQHPLNPSVPVIDAGAGEGPAGRSQRVAGKSFSITPTTFAAAAPEYLIICPCGLTLEQAWREAELLAQHDWFRSLPAVRQQRVAVVDGNQMFNRPGPRLVDALEFLVGWLNQRPDQIPRDFPWRPFVV